MSKMKLQEFLDYFYDKYGSVTMPFDSTKVGQPRLSTKTSGSYRLILSTILSTN